MSLVQDCILIKVVGFVILCHLLSLNCGNAEVKEKSCKAIMADLTKRQLSGISTCIKALKLKGGKDKAKMMNCILKCAMENEGLVSKKGEISRDQIDTLLAREFPPSLVDRANKTFQPCVEKFDGTLDANSETDPLCASYDPVIKCLMGALPSLCPPA